MRIFNEWTLIFMSVALFFILKTINERHNNDIKLYLIEFVLENEPNISAMQLEDKVNQYYNIAKGIKND